MVDIILGLVILMIIGLAVWKIVKEKKKGAKCIGCPYSGNTSCHCNTSDNG